MLDTAKTADPLAADRDGLAGRGLRDLIDLNRSLLGELSSLQALLDNPPPEPDGGRSELRRRFAATLRELRRSRDELDRLGDRAGTGAETDTDTDSPREVSR